MATHNAKKNACFYYCEVCDFVSSNLTDYTRHSATQKHVRNTMATTSNTKNAFCLQCDICSKIYKNRSGLWRHKIKGGCCSKNNSTNEEDILTKNSQNEPTDKQLILKLIQENAEMRKALVETCHKIQPSTINNNVSNSHNKTFNLQFFLNETCKDALNINEFVSSIKIQLTDLETTGRVGYVEGISKIILHNLNSLEQYRRPIHCSDLKREILYIKDNNEWTKEDAEKPLFTKAIKLIANENIKKISEWTHNNPDCTDSCSKKNNTYLNIVSNSMSGSSYNETSKNICKIISNVTKAIQIDKE
jgi:hypothetical protein